MKVQCAWCKKWAPEKAPLSDTSVSHGICPACAKIYSQSEAPPWTALTRRNPGESWHAGKMEEAERSETRVKKPSLKDFYHGKAIAHFESALEERARAKTKKNPQYPRYKAGPYSVDTFVEAQQLAGVVADRTGEPVHVMEKLDHLTSWHSLKVVHPSRKNPLAVFGLGNPPNRVSAKVSGIIYTRCLEVKAEKTGRFQKGLWKHTFEKGSQVHLLALDNGDILLHSAAGVRLWENA